MVTQRDLEREVRFGLGASELQKDIRKGTIYSVDALDKYVSEIPEDEKDPLLEGFVRSRQFEASGALSERDRNAVLGTFQAYQRVIDEATVQEAVNAYRAMGYPGNVPDQIASSTQKIGDLKKQLESGTEKEKESAGKILEGLYNLIRVTTTDKVRFDIDVSHRNKILEKLFIESKEEN